MIFCMIFSRHIMWFDKENVPAFEKEVELKAKNSNLTSYPLESKDISDSLYRFKITNLEESNQNNSNNSNSH